MWLTRFKLTDYRRGKLGRVLGWLLAALAVSLTLPGKSQFASRMSSTFELWAWFAVFLAVGLGGVTTSVLANRRPYCVAMVASAIVFGALIGHYIGSRAYGGALWCFVLALTAFEEAHEEWRG